jgi:hypothetical protein
MDILNFISWTKEGNVVATISSPDKALIPVGLYDLRRDDNYLPSAISVTDLLASVAPTTERTDYLIIAASDEINNLSIGTSKVTFRMPYSGTLQNVKASVTTASTGTSIIVDINNGGVSILSTKLSIDATEKTSTTATIPVVISNVVITENDEISIDIDQVGSTFAGVALKIYFEILIP